MEEFITLDADLKPFQRALAFGYPFPEVVLPAVKHAPGAHDQDSHGNWSRGYTQGVLFAESELPPVVPLKEPGPGKGGKVKVFVRGYDMGDPDDSEGVEWEFGNSNATTELLYGVDLRQVVKEVKSAYSAPGLNVEADIVDMTNSYRLFVEIRGEIYKETEVERRVRGRRETTLSSERVGEFKDTIEEWDPGGGGGGRSIESPLRILNAGWMALDPEYRGKGFAKAVAFNKMRLAHSLGLNAVVLEADATIGRYAWAKYGASYANPERAKRAFLQFKAWASASHGFPEPSTGWPEFKTPYDVATYKHPEGYTFTTTSDFNPDVKAGEVYDLGKAFMLDYSGPYGHGNWDAVVWVNKPIWVED